MHMRVHADAGLVVAHGHDQVGGLAADAVQREQLVDRVGHPPAEALQQVAADPEDDGRLRAIEADGVDEARDARSRQLQHGLGRGRHREQPVGRRTGRRVLGAEREDAGDQDAKRIASAVGDDRERRRVPARRAPPEAADHGADR